MKPMRNRISRPRPKRVQNQRRLNKKNINPNLPTINMVFSGDIDWTFEKILEKYKSHLSSKYNILPSVQPILGCDVYQYWRPTCVMAQRNLLKLSESHEFLAKSVHMIHDSPQDVKRHNTSIREKTIDKFNQVLCTSKEQYDYYCDKATNIHYIPLAPLNNDIFPLKTTHNENERIRIGFVGRLYPDKVKNEDLLIQIARSLNPNKFEFIIHSPNGQRLIRYLKSFGFDVNRKKEIDVLLVCSKYEGTPLPLIEACASGAYVLSTNVGEANKVLYKKQICQTGEDFIVSLNKIEANRKDLQNFIYQGPARVKNRTWENHVHHVEKVWEQIINLNVNTIKDITIPQNKKKRLFIIGGASSVSSMDLNRLKNEDVMCVNKSIELFERPKYFVTMDYTFFQKINDPNLLSISKAENSYFILNTSKNIFVNHGSSIYDKTRKVEYKNINQFDYVIESKKSYPFSNNIKDFAHGENSGFCAIQLALLLGYEEINLIGFDMIVPRNGKTHYHNAYDGNSTFIRRSRIFQNNFIQAFSHYNHSAQIRTITPSAFFEKYIPKISLDQALLNDMPQKNLMVVGYYTKNTPYEKEAKKLIQSLKKHKLNYDIVGIKSFGSWQSNTRYKVKFLKEMLDKHQSHNLLYVDVDAVIHQYPSLFTESYQYDIAVRWQDFRWRKNECLSGTIYLANNKMTRELCDYWEQLNNSEDANTKTYEQWNLGKAIIKMRNERKIQDVNLPPEYTMIFDSMRAMYPNVKPVIEHFQASRKHNEQRKK